MLLPQLRAKLLARLALLTEAKQFDEKTSEVWQEFLAVSTEEPDKNAPVDLKKQGEAVRRQFESFRSALLGDPRLKYEAAVKRALAEFEERGLLDKLEDTQEEHKLDEVIVYPEKAWNDRKPVAVIDVRIADVKPRLLANLKRELGPLEKEIIEQARRQSRQVYVLNLEPLTKLRTRLKDAIDTLAKSEKFDDATAKLWRDFQPKPTDEAPLPSPEEQQKLFEKFREALVKGPPSEELDAAMAKVLAEYEKNGLLGRLKGSDEAAEGNQEEIIVAGTGSDAGRRTVKVSSVRLSDIKPKLREALEKELKSLELAARVFIYLERELPGVTTLEYQPPKMGEGPLAVDPKLAERTYDFLERKLPKTLEYDKEKTEVVSKLAVAEVNAEKLNKKYEVGKTKIIDAGQTIGPAEIALLKREHDAEWTHLSKGWVVGRLTAVLGMYFALYTLCGFFVYYRYPGVLADLGRLAGLLALTVLTVSLCCLLDVQGAEMVPLLLFGMTVAIAYHQELALLLLAAVGLVVVLSLGQGLPSYVVLTAAGATAVLLLRRVRNRTKLIFVGAAAGLVAMLTTVGVAVVDGQTVGSPLWQSAGMAWVWCLTAGFVMTGLLPFIEHIFGVLTEISLLELGDVAHPLLQELVRRAPGTYNHSINVASMAEAAAERIGAQGLLVRVGAYFHDIGKVLKPQYFAENQLAGDNRHESLVPAMSTLIIIAHVKDGADLARQHHLPRPIIDFIQQHHGTTLVEYFYRRASEQSSEDPDASEIDENAFRYPGPKPQSKEAGILMLSDAVESASRVLVEPTPARIVNLVEQLTMNRLLDGQFDECGLTLQEVHMIQESLVKSLTAVYHGRVKYPEPITA